MPINYLQDANFNKSRCIIHNSTAFLQIVIRTSYSYVTNTKASRCQGAAELDSPFSCCSDWSFKASWIWSCLLATVLTPCLEHQEFLLVIVMTYLARWFVEYSREMQRAKKSVCLRSHSIGWWRPNLSSSLELSFPNTCSLTLKMQRAPSRKDRRKDVSGLWGNIVSWSLTLDYKAHQSRAQWQVEEVYEVWHKSFSQGLTMDESVLPFGGAFHCSIWGVCVCVCFTEKKGGTDGSEKSISIINFWATPLSVTDTCPPIMELCQCVCVCVDPQCTSIVSCQCGLPIQWSWVNHSFPICCNSTSTLMFDEVVPPTADVTSSAMAFSGPGPHSSNIHTKRVNLSPLKAFFTMMQYSSGGS